MPAARSSARRTSSTISGELMGRVIPLTESNKFTRDTGGVQGETRFINLELVDYYRPCLVPSGQKNATPLLPIKLGRASWRGSSRLGFFTRRPAPASLS